MDNKFTKTILKECEQELNSTIIAEEILCIAIFSINKELLFSNHLMNLLIGDNEPVDSFLNPNFDTLLSSLDSEQKTFEGFITIGNLSKLNTSVFAKVFKKNQSILIVGSFNIADMLKQNETMHKLNKEINNLQRNLIKEKKNLESTLLELDNSNRQLVELNATKDKFFSLIAHDLKNPFLSLLGFSEILIENADTFEKEHIKEFSRLINDTSKHTYNLLENLLEWSKLQTGKLQINIQKHITSKIILETVNICESNAKEKKINLIVDNSYDGDILCDKEMISTTLRNLITNAIKFSPIGEKIHINCDTKNQEIIFSISCNTY